MNSYVAWAHPQLAAQVLRTRRGGFSEIALSVETLSDARQVLQLEQLIRSLPGVQRVGIDRRARRVRVLLDIHRTPLPILLANFAAAGCPAQPLQHASIDDDRSQEQHDALKRLLVAGMCAMQVMTYAFVIYIGVVDFVDFSTRNLFRWLGLLTSVPVVFYSALPFFRGALQERRDRRLGVNLPIALAVALVFAASMYNTFRGSGEIYFDSVTMFVTLLLGGRYLELRSRHRSGAMSDATIDRTPLLAQRRGADGQLETVPAMTLLPGDRVHIAEGARVPADGVLQNAHVRVDEAMLSGESRPLRRLRGEQLTAGSVLLTGPAELIVEHSGHSTTVARLGELAMRARAARSLVAVSDREVGRFVARVLGLTTLTALGWLLIDPTRAFESAVAVLVVACPCAFALTRPAALTRALGVLAGRGVLVTNGEALERLAAVDYALFDKTGTLTVPQLDRRAVEPLRGDTVEHVLQWAAALAHESSHPLARALADTARQQALPLQPSSVHVVAGAGISGNVAGRTLWLGRADFALAPSGTVVSSDAGNALLLADANGPIAAFHLEEQPRVDARRVLDSLRFDGITISLASGDAANRVATIADQLGIADWHARQSPVDKLERLQAARAEGRTTLAVGDGGNDAPLLAGADVSAALASGTELAQAHAGVLLMDGRLSGLIDARAIACQLHQVIAQGRRWALVYNLCAVPFAAFGLVPPWLAGIGMSLSSLMVVMNAVRVGRHNIFEEDHSGPNAATRQLPA